MLSRATHHHNHNVLNPKSERQTLEGMEAIWQSRQSAQTRMANCSSFRKYWFPLAFHWKKTPHRSITNTPWWSPHFPLVPVDPCAGLVPRMPGAEPQATPSLAIWQQVDTFILQVSGAPNGTVTSLLQSEQLSGMRGHPRFQAAKESRLSLAQASATLGHFLPAWVGKPQRT